MMQVELLAVEAVMRRYEEREAVMTRMQSILLATDVLNASFENRDALVVEVSGRMKGRRGDCCLVSSGDSSRVSLFWFSVS